MRIIKIYGAIYLYLYEALERKEKEVGKTGAKLSVNKRDDQRAGWRERERFCDRAQKS